MLVELEALARSWFESGKTSVGIGFLCEILRWNQGIKTNSHDDFKINNDFRAHYARMMIARNPEWEGRIRVRALRTA
ncbi:hypothetical protein ACWDTQ_28205 [Streptomyces cellulosae]